MGDDGDARSRWHLGGRHYLLWELSGPDLDEVELEDVGPGPGRGFLSAVKLGGSGEISITADLAQPVPIEVLDRFLAEVDARFRSGT
ncbi:MAG: hypothetical protein ACTHN0_05065, partial [Aquihabitans sp.]